MFKALSNPNRLLIVDASAKGERCVADLTELVGLDMSTVSNHLSVLRNVGFVKDERRGHAGLLHPEKSLRAEYLLLPR